jgi:hypothetical protein
MKSTVTICLLVLALPLRARADSPEPLSLDYFVQVSGNTVIVCGLRQGEWIYRSGLTMLR